MLLLDCGQRHSSWLPALVKRQRPSRYIHLSRDRERAITLTVHYIDPYIVHTAVSACPAGPIQVYGASQPILTVQLSAASQLVILPDSTPRLAPLLCPSACPCITRARCMRRARKAQQLDAVGAVPRFRQGAGDIDAFDVELCGQFDHGPVHR